MLVDYVSRKKRSRALQGCHSTRDISVARVRDGGIVRLSGVLGESISTLRVELLALCDAVQNIHFRGVER